ncbi:MAG: CsgG/HfaB family protein, partial [Treponema sp.]
MKKIILLTVFVVIASAGSVFAQSRTMAVMPFDVVGNAVTADEAEALTELYISAVIETGRVRVIDRANFDKVMKELNFQTSDWSNSEKTAKLGKALNAKFISRGKIMKLGSNLSISSSVIDIETAENVASTKAIYKDIDELVARFFLEPSAWSYYDSGKLDDMLKDVADFYSGQGQAGGSIFYSDGNNFYEAVFLQGLVSFKEALELASGYYAGYND